MAEKKFEMVQSRLDHRTKKQLQNKCQEIGVGVSYFLREVIEAFIGGRLRIVKRKNQSITIKGVHIDGTDD